MLNRYFQKNQVQFQISKLLVYISSSLHDLAPTMFIFLCSYFYIYRLYIMYSFLYLLSSVNFVSLYYIYFISIGTYIES